MSYQLRKEAYNKLFDLRKRRIEESLKSIKLTVLIAIDAWHFYHESREDIVSYTDLMTKMYTAYHNMDLDVDQDQYAAIYNKDPLDPNHSALTSKNLNQKQSDQISRYTSYYLFHLKDEIFSRLKSEYNDYCSSNFLWPYDLNRECNKYASLIYNSWRLQRIVADEKNLIPESLMDMEKKILEDCEKLYEVYKNKKEGSNLSFEDFINKLDDLKFLESSIDLFDDIEEIKNKTLIDVDFNIQIFGAKPDLKEIERSIKFKLKDDKRPNIQTWCKENLELLSYNKLKKSAFNDFTYDFNESNAFYNYLEKDEKAKCFFGDLRFDIRKSGTLEECGVDTYMAGKCAQFAERYKPELICAITNDADHKSTIKILSEYDSILVTSHLNKENFRNRKIKEAIKNEESNKTVDYIYAKKKITFDEYVHICFGEYFIDLPKRSTLEQLISEWENELKRAQQNIEKIKYVKSLFQQWINKTTSDRLRDDNINVVNLRDKK